MLLIKNDPELQRAMAARPGALQAHLRRRRAEAARRRWRNDGKLSPHLPEGTPFGLVGTSSLYKRESYPNGVRAAGKRDRDFAGGTDRPASRTSTRSTPRSGVSLQLGQPGRRRRPLRQRATSTPSASWSMEPTTDRHRAQAGPTFRSHANERLRILGEIPVRKFVPARTARRSQPTRPDGNPDTSFLAKIPADVAFTFQTLDKDGMVLNMAQTWHQLRPGEIRNNCGGCHAHSQKPTLFEDTAAAKADYQVFDLTEQTPLLTDQEERPVRQEVGRQGRDRPALRQGRQERRVLPRRQADPRPQLRRLPHAEVGQAGRQPGPGRRRQIGRAIAGNGRRRCPAPTYRLAHGLRRPGSATSRAIGSLAARATPRATSACSSRGAAC